MKLATINLIVTDAHKTRTFYVNAFGLKENQHRSQSPHFYYLESEGAALTIGQPHRGGVAIPATDSIEIGFEVADLTDIKRKIQAAGATDIREESMDWGDTVQAHDPDGHRVIVYRLKGK